jgi:hypothetical protein
VWSSLSFSQESRGTLSGRVTDDSGAVLVGAQISAIRSDTGVSLDARTNESGIFAIPFLLPGIYEVTVEQSGFKTLHRTNVEVRVNETVQLELALTLGDISQKVEVSAATPVLQTGEANLGQVIDQHRISELPNASGNTAELVSLAPGVSSGSAIAVHKAAFNNGTSSIVADGNALKANEWAIDGVPNMFAAGTAPRIAFSPPPTTISEFKVQTTFYDAAIGHTSGAVINMNTNSGTNDLHGELHEYFGNSALNATDFFANRAGQEKETYQDNRYGGAVGGPIILPKLYNGRNKTFFFYVFEGNKWGSPEPYSGTVPTDAERQGDFSALLALGPQYQIYDPYSTTNLGNGQYGRTPFPNNVIPSSKLNAVGSNLAKFYPEPNAAGSTDGTNNYVFANYSAKEDYYAHFLRVDENFSEKSRMFVRLDYDYWNEQENQFFGPNNPAASLTDGRINKGLAVDEVYILSSTNIFNIRYGLTQQSFPAGPAARGFNLASLGFSPTLVSQIPSNLATFPDSTFTSFSELGATGGYGTNTSIIHTLSGSFTTLLGNHNLHYGIDFRLNRANQEPYSTTPSPSLTFNSTYTNGPFSTSPSAPIGQDLASMLLGIPQGQAQQIASFADQDTWYGGYIQDDWRLTPKLTLNLGFRLEHESPVTERFNRAVQGFDYTAQNPIAAQAMANYANSPIPGLPASAFQVLGGLTFAGGQNGRNFWNGQSVEPMPRVAFAYRLTPTTVIRSGFGLFFDTIGVYRSPAIQTGFTSTTSIVPTYDNGVTWATSLTNPLPNGIQSPLGATGGLTTNLGQALSVYSRNLRIPYSERYSFGIQQELGAGYLLDVSYVGNHGIRLPVVHQLNTTPAAYLSTSPTRDQATINYLSQQFSNPFYGLSSVYPKTISRASLLEPYPEFGNIQETESNGYSHYNALQLQVSKRFSRGYTVNVAYTFSKMMDATGYLNASDATPWYGISTYDRPQRIAISSVWELPVGRGRTFLSNMPKGLDYVIGGWELTAAFTYQSGDALNWGNIIFNGNLHDIPLSSSQRGVDHWFNTGAGFVTSASQQLADNVVTFPLRLGGVRGDGQDVWNISIVKNFALTDRVRLQLRGSGYNALNHPNFNDPSTTVTSGSFGKVTGMDGYPRQAEIAARIIF